MNLPFMRATGFIVVCASCQQDAPAPVSSSATSTPAPMFDAATTAPSVSAFAPTSDLKEDPLRGIFYRPPNPIPWRDTGDLCGLCPNWHHPPPPPSPPRLPDDELEALWADHELGGIERWRELLAPMFGEPHAELREAAKTGAPDIAAFQTLPSAEVAFARRFESARITELRRESEPPRWLKGVDARAWAVPLALRPPIVPEDALLRAWKTDGRRIQFIGTEDSGFIRTTLDQSCGESPREMAAAALELARDLLWLPGEPCRTDWWVKAYGPVVVAEITMGSGHWYQHLILVSDGANVKFILRGSRSPSALVGRPSRPLGWPPTRRLFDPRQQGKGS